MIDKPQPLSKRCDHEWYWVVSTAWFQCQECSDRSEAIPMWYLERERAARMAAEEDTKIALDSNDELLRQAVAARAKLAKAIEALAFYAEGPLTWDRGTYARQALARLRGRGRE